MTLLTKWIAKFGGCLVGIGGVETPVLTVFTTNVAMVCLVGNESKPTEIIE
tara:strand:+ start:4001 stop:4153 length:153 start_codon:yes stop_codon:yes gene_type:complete